MLGIVLSGGLVQAVVTDDPKLQAEDVLVIDYDTDGVDEADLVGVRQLAGSVAGKLVPAYVYIQRTWEAGIDLEGTMRRYDEKEGNA